MQRTIASIVLPLLAACASAEPPEVSTNASGQHSDTSNADHSLVGDEGLPLGTWTFTLGVPNVSIWWTFHADHTFELSQTVAPVTTPVGATLDGPSCNVYRGTYSVALVNGVDTLTWEGDGWMNVSTECPVASMDSVEGTPVTNEELPAYIAQGMLPPQSFAFALESDALVINADVVGSFGLSARTVLVKEAP